MNIYLTTSRDSSTVSTKITISMQCTTTLLAVLLAVFSLAECHSSPAEGEPCTVRNPERCEDEPSAVMMSAPEPVEDGFGPNVCVTRRMETVSFADYEVKRFCKTRFRRQFCYSFCVRGENQTCSLRNITTAVYDCCAGFAAPSSSRDHGFGYGRFNRHPGYRTLRRMGCTVELRPSVADCLTELNLTDFQAALVDTELGGRLASADEEFTVFAPTNDAISGQLISESSLMTHILDEVVKNSDLRSFAVLRPLNKATLLHVTDVHIFSLRWFFKLAEETYINGAEVLRGDACLAENGVVHTVKSIIPSSPDSIAELLAADPQFSDFTRLLEATNISQFLGAGRNTSRTVFAPTNDAFAKLPEGAVDCLLRPENKRHAKQLVLTHITAPAEYTSSLSQRRYVRTFYFYRRLLVCVINDTIHLTRDNIPLSETDITARNGVIHSLESVLLSDCLDYEKLCPTTPSPTPEVTEDPEQLPTSVEETGSGGSVITPTFPLPIIPSEPDGPLTLRSS